jgi:hypothetical protein
MFFWKVTRLKGDRNAPNKIKPPKYMNTLLESDPIERGPKLDAGFHGMSNPRLPFWKVTRLKGDRNIEDFQSSRITQLHLFFWKVTRLKGDRNIFDSFFLVIHNIQFDLLESDPIERGPKHLT